MLWVHFSDYVISEEKWEERKKYYDMMKLNNANRASMLISYIPIDICGKKACQTLAVHLNLIDSNIEQEKNTQRTRIERMALLAE